MCLTKYHAMKTLALDGDEQSASRPGRFTRSTHWIGEWFSLTKSQSKSKL